MDIFPEPLKSEADESPESWFLRTEAEGPAARKSPGEHVAIQSARKTKNCPVHELCPSTLNGPARISVEERGRRVDLGGWPGGPRGEIDVSIRERVKAAIPVSTLPP